MAETARERAIRLIARRELARPEDLDASDLARDARIRRVTRETKAHLAASVATRQ